MFTLFSGIFKAVDNEHFTIKSVLAEAHTLKLKSGTGLSYTLTQKCIWVILLAHIEQFLSTLFNNYTFFHSDFAYFCRDTLAHSYMQQNCTRGHLV